MRAYGEIGESFLPAKISAYTVLQIELKALVDTW